MIDKFEQWWNDIEAIPSEEEEFARFVWNAALSSLQGEQAAKIAEQESRIKELERQLAEVGKDAERYRMMRSLDATPYDKWNKAQKLLYRAMNSAYTIEMVDTAVDTAIQESKKGIV